MKLRLLDVEAALDEAREIPTLPLPDEPEFEPLPEEEPEEQPYESINRYGHPDFYWPGSETAVCTQCGDFKIENRGQGTLCDNCMHADIAEAMQDY